MSDNSGDEPVPQRMPSIPPEEWTEEIRDFFAVYEGEEGRTKGSKYNFSHWLANHPSLGQAWMQFNLKLTLGVFQPYLRELIVLRVAHLFQSEYEWNLHEQISVQYGIGPDHLAAIKAGADDPKWNDMERLCLRAADALCLRHDIDDELWAQLAAQFNRKELVELMFLVGSYTMLAWALKSVRLPPEDLRAAWH